MRAGNEAKMPDRVFCRVLENLQVQVIAGGHSWVADEPRDSKGDGLGPNPFDLLLSAIGTCTALEIAVMAASARVPIEAISVELTGDWEGGGREKRYRILRRVRVRGEFPEKDLERIQRWAERCPVGQIVEKGAEVRTEVGKV